MKNIWFCICAFALLTACKQPVKMEEGVTVYGEDFTVKDDMDFDKVVI